MVISFKDEKFLKEETVVKVDRQTAEYMGAFEENFTIDDVERARGKEL